MFKCVYSSFFHTIGRILAYLSIGAVVAYFMFIGGCENVKADELDYYSNNIHKSTTVTGWDLVSNDYTYIEPLNPSPGIYEIPCNVGPSAYGCGISFDTGVEFKSGYYYSVKVYIGVGNNAFVRTNSYFNPAVSELDWGSIWNSYHAPEKLSLFSQYADSIMYYFTTPDYDSYSGNTITYIFKMGNDVSPGDILFIPILAEYSTDRIYFYGSITESLGSDLSSAELERILGQSNQVIINQNEQILDKQEQIESGIGDINDNITSDEVDTSKSDSFFSNFDTEDNGGLSSVVTAPLTFVRKLTDRCTPLSIPFYDKNISLPCGDELFWNRDDVSAFRNTWNVLFGGAIVYMLMTKLFKVINNLKNPDDSRIEVMDL